MGARICCSGCVRHHGDYPPLQRLLRRVNLVELFILSFLRLVQALPAFRAPGFVLPGAKNRLTTIVSQKLLRRRSCAVCLFKTVV